MPPNTNTNTKGTNTNTRWMRGDAEAGTSLLREDANNPREEDQTTRSGAVVSRWARQVYGLLGRLMRGPSRGAPGPSALERGEGAEWRLESFFGSVFVAHGLAVGLYAWVKTAFCRPKIESFTDEDLRFEDGFPQLAVENGGGKKKLITKIPPEHWPKQTTVNGGTFKFRQPTETTAQGIDRLHYISARGAFHNAAERYPHPEYRPETDTGKDCYCTCYVQKLEAEGRLGESFFFKRGDLPRGNGNILFPTIAHQLALLGNLPGLSQAIIRAVQHNPHVLFRSLSLQLQKLTIQPFLQTSSSAGDIALARR
ncbi:hypothetical protein FB451DRAFT_1194198 [Mycena latifolia]|nr:hypothetical protein FB451DRAFT_1194198 [Mycena latifolia]